MATRKSTNINELPSMNSLANQRSDDDDAIAEVLEEIENENMASQNGPQIPMETMPQGPSTNNIPQPMVHPMNQIQQNQQHQQHQQPQQNQQPMMQQIPTAVPTAIRITAQGPLNQNPLVNGPGIDQQSIQHNVLNNLKHQLLAENFVDTRQKTYDNRTMKFLDDIKSNSTLLIVIFLSNLMLQNASIKNLLLSKFERFNNSYVNLAVIAVVQVLAVMLLKNVV